MSNTITPTAFYRTLNGSSVRSKRTSLSSLRTTRLECGLRLYSVTTPGYCKPALRSRAARRRDFGTISEQN